MAQTVIDQMKAWAAPALVVLILSMSAYIWNSEQVRVSEQAARIASLETEATSANAALASISASQKASLDDRAAFQASTTVRLDKMQDTLSQVGQSLAALTAIQQEQSAQQRLPPKQGI